jgi:hypothetical protein
MKVQTGILGLTAAMLIAACGGGGGGGASNPPAPSPVPPPPVPAATPPVITGPATALPPSTAGSPAPGATITATGTPPISFAVSAGSLPPGMSLNANSGAISGTPLVSASYQFTVTATNAAGTASAPFTQFVAFPTPNANLLLSGNRMVVVNLNVPTDVSSAINLTGVRAGESMKGIARRPNNGFLYGFGVDAASGYGTLYSIASNGVSTPLYQIAGFALDDGSMNTRKIQGSRYGVHVSPGADVLRVANNAGQNFRYNMATGQPVDGNPAVVLAQMDTSINGARQSVDALAYTNNNLFSTLSTLYTVEALSDTLCIQFPANSGTQGNCLPLSSPIDDVFGFDIPPGIDVQALGVPVTSGSATAIIRLAGETTQRLAQIDLTTGTIAASPPAIGFGGIESLAIQNMEGIPMYALSFDGTQLLVFAHNDPGIVVTRTITGVAASEDMVAIDFQPSTGRLYGLGVDGLFDHATLYEIAPQSGTAVAVSVGAIGLNSDQGFTRDMVNGLGGIGFDFNPSTGQIRVSMGNDLNFRIDPETGEEVDGNPNIAGPQADADITPAIESAAGLAYTNGLDVGGNRTTLYALSSAGHLLCRIVPPSSGALTDCQVLMLNGFPVPWSNAMGFDIAGNVRAPSADAAVNSGSGYVAASQLGITHLYRINLVTREVTDLGLIGNGMVSVGGLAIGLNAVQ